MTAMITRIAQVQTTTDYPGICVFVKISGDEGDWFFASPSRSNAAWPLPWSFPSSSRSRLSSSRPGEG